MTKSVYVYLTSGAMAFGDVGGSRIAGPRVDGSVVSFCCELPESYVYLESQGVVELDTSVVPDVLGLRALYEDAEPTRVLPGRVQNSVQVLVSDARAKPLGFHDMTNVSGPAVSMADMSHLQRQWPTSLLTGMTRRQTDLELLRWECKHQFCNMQAGICAHCGRHIVHDMACHVSTYHLDLRQLWRRPVSYSPATPRGSLSENCQSGEVVPAVDSNANSVECGVEAECVGHLYRRGAFQRAWDPAGPPLPGVRRLCLPWLSAWNFQDQVDGFH